MSTIITDLISYIVAGEALAANDAIYIDSSDGRAYKFDVTDDTQTFAGIAKESAVLGASVKVVQSGRIKGFSGLTAGAFVYASTTTPGSFQIAEPVASQKIILGIAKSATELVINGGLGIKPGGDGGGGGLDVYYTEDMEGLADVSGFSTGNNAAFMGGGTLQGTLALDSVSPISGTKSLTYTQAAGSLNDYFASELIDIDFKQQNNDSGMTFYFTYDGDDNDLKFVVYDVTNSAELTSGVELVKSESSARRYALSFFVPATCDEIRWGVQVLIENDGAVLTMDDVSISSDPFVYKDLIDPRTVVRGAGNAGQSITANVTDIPFTEVEDELGLWDGSTFTAPEDGDYIVEGHVKFNATAARAVTLYVNGLDTERAGEASAVSNHHFSGVLSLQAGDAVSVRVVANGGTLVNELVEHHIHIQKIPEPTEHVITPAKSNMSDWESFTPSFDSLGVVSNVYARWRRQGQNIEVYGRVTVGTPTAGSAKVSLPENLVIDASNIPSGNLVKVGTAARGVGTTDQFHIVAGGGDDTQVLFSRMFNGGLTGIGGTDLMGPGDSIGFNFSVPIQGWTSDVTLLAAIPTPKTAYIKDVKASGTNGGTFTSGAWQTRDLNTLEGDTGFVSLSGNQFTLQPGKYEIEVSAPAFSVARHKAKLVRDPSGTPVDAIVGSSELANAAGNQHTTSSVIKGSITLTTSSVYEVQHQCETTRATNGFGQSTSFGVDEVFTQISIKKVG